MLQLTVLVATLGLAGVVAYSSRRHLLPAEVVVLVATLLIHVAISLVFAAFGGISITSGSATTMFISGEQSSSAGLILLAAASIVTACALLLSPLLRKKGNFPGTTQARSMRDMILSISSTRGVRIALAMALLAMILALSLNFQTLMWRPSYQFAEKGSVSNLLLSLTLPAGIFGAIIFSINPSSQMRFFAACLLALSASIEISRASRSLAVLVFAAALASALLSKHRLIVRLVTAASGAILAAVALIVVIQLRGTSTTGYGLFPALARLADGRFSFAADRWASMVNNLVASIPITYLSAGRPVPDGFLWTSLSPEQGSGTDWYSIAPYLSIAAGVPTNAVGQIASLDLAQYFAAWAFITLLLCAPAMMRKQLPGTIAMPLTWLCVVIVAIASLQLLQYSLRTASRFIWLSFGLVAVVWIVWRINASLASKKVPQRF